MRTFARSSCSPAAIQTARWRALRTGTLILRDDAEGLHFTAAALPDTSYARDLRAGMEAQSADFGS